MCFIDLCMDPIQFSMGSIDIKTGFNDLGVGFAVSGIELIDLGMSPIQFSMDFIDIALTSMIWVWSSLFLA